ncbi:MAG: YeeE/YedE family protein [Saprospiraceae bacterium]|nr:YeeE/YedE family protein [Saprospiraceae bacterium]
MKNWRFLLIGMLFGIIMTKSQAVSWYRIQEMFRFESFHMYGIMGSAALFGIIFIFLIKKYKLNDAAGEAMDIKPKEKAFWRYLLGGTIFGLGWAMTGACPGPLYVLVGNGILVMLVVLVSAVLGALIYGAVRKYLPH